MGEPPPQGPGASLCEDELHGQDSTHSSLSSSFSPSTLVSQETGGRAHTTSPRVLRSWGAVR